jgi:alpha-mannosidase
MENPNLRKWNLFVVPGSHFDLGWCASPAETFAYGDIIIKEAIDAIISKFPEYRFTVEYAMFLKHFLDTYPHYKDIVKQLINDGKLEVSALWTGMMDQIMDGEAEIRNVILAKRWVKEQFGIDLITAQSSDCPGHTIQLAQILARCGIKYLAYSRYSAPIPLHKWLSPDGSSIIAANHSVGLYKSLVDASWAGSGYGWGLIFMRNLEDVERMLPSHLKDIENLWPQEQPVLMGAESDLIPAYLDMVPKVKQWNEKYPDIQLEFSTITNFFENVEPKELPEFMGELPYEFYTLGACFPHIYTKARYAHNMLTTAEKMLSLEEILGLGYGNKASLDRAWEGLTIPHDHNVGGRHGEINDVVRYNCVETAMVSANNVSEEAMLFVMTEIDYPENSGIPIVVFNPMSWKRSEVVETYIETGEKDFENITVFDTSGNPLPTQLLRAEGKHNHKRLHFLFMADMPSVGYNTFYVKFPKEKPLHPNTISSSKDVFENQQFRISLEEGIIKNLFWKPGNVELAKGSEFGELIVRENTESDIWDNLTGNVWLESKEDRQIEIVESGSLRGKLRIKSEILGCEVVKELSLYDSSPYIEFSVTIDWAGERDREVLLSMPLNVPDGQIAYETPYGHVTMGKDEMPGTYRGKGGRYVQKWVDVSNDEMGVCIGTDCISHVLNDTDVMPMLIRTAYSCGTPHHWYDNVGKHSFKFSLLPHIGGWSSSLAFRRGWEHSTPMPVGRMNICIPIAPFRGRTFLTQNYSLCNVSPDNVVLTTIKRADNDGDGYVVRLVEVAGKASSVMLNFGFELIGAWKTDLLENDLYELACEDAKVGLHILPYEIYTVRIMPEKAHPIT